MSARRAVLFAVLFVFAGAQAALGQGSGAAHQVRKRWSPLVTNNCLGCHDEHLIEQQRLTVKQWAAVVKKMQGWGAPIELGNIDRLANELAAKYGDTVADVAGMPIDAQAAQAALEVMADGPYGSRNLRKGQSLYQAACLQCHGVDGRGTDKGVALTDRPLLFRAAEFAAVVRGGRGRMPQFSLPKSDIGAILAHLRQLK